jgi:hypothetical protein
LIESHPSQSVAECLELVPERTAFSTPSASRIDGQRAHPVYAIFLSKPWGQPNTAIWINLTKYSDSSLKLG